MGRGGVLLLAVLALAALAAPALAAASPDVHAHRPGDVAAATRVGVDAVISDDPGMARKAIAGVDEG